MDVFSTLVSFAEIPVKNVKCGKVSLKAPREREGGRQVMGRWEEAVWYLATVTVASW